MIIKVIFEKTNNVIPFSNQKQMNGFIHTVIGKDNKYHDTFSLYSISSILGGHIDKSGKGLVFDQEPYILVSSMDIEFLNAFSDGFYSVMYNNGADFFGIKPIGLEVYDYSLSKGKFDVIKTNSPILLKNKSGFKLTCKDQEWLPLLKEHCISKLKHCGIEDDTFDIVAKNPQALKSKMVMVGNVFNPCTNAVLTVYGKHNTRKTLYSMGIGCSTGSGFGSVSLVYGCKDE